MRSIEDYKKALARRCQSAGKDAWVLGWGYDDTLVTEMRHPTRADLDAACPRHPVFVRHVSGHMAVVNSAALAKASRDELSTVGVDERSGKLTEPRAMQVVSRHFPPAGPEAAQRGLARANEVYAAAGVTTADCSNIRMLTELPKMQNGILRNNLNLRVVLHPLGYYPTTLASGKTVDSAGWINRAALGWSSGRALAGRGRNSGHDRKQRPLCRRPQGRGRRQRHHPAVHARLRGGQGRRRLSRSGGQRHCRAACWAVGGQPALPRRLEVHF